VRLSELQAALARHFAVVRFAPDGKHLECEALKPLTSEIVKGLQEHRGALLEAVQNEAKRGHTAPSDDSRRLTSEPISPTNPARWPAPAVVARSQQPGHCGCCARWVARPAPAEHMGECSAGRAALGELHGDPLAPVEIQATHACQAHGGSGWRAMPKIAEAECSV